MDSLPIKAQCCSDVAVFINLGREDGGAATLQFDIDPAGANRMWDIKVTQYACGSRLTYGKAIPPVPWDYKLVKKSVSRTGLQTDVCSS